MILSSEDFEYMMNAARKIRETDICVGDDAKHLSLIAWNCAKARAVILAIENDITPLKRAIEKSFAALSRQAIIEIHQDVARRKSVSNVATDSND